MLTEIRWHSRAGQGAITAANALAHLAIQTGKKGQSFPEFGAEKRGAPVKVFNRIGEHKIEITTEIEHPDIVILLDTTLVNHEISYDDVLEGLKTDGILIINTEQKDTKFNQLFSGKIYHIAASKIALEKLQRDLPNVPMLAALLQVSKLLEYKTTEQELEKLLLESFPTPIVAANMQAFKDAYAKVQQAQ
ncbi:MAG: 2-oxoacid:acceptor oxidoreductase family protein [Candidatus Gracilibacteria bacterium]|nr:2-oxoacid:acceptor oxidoreductase family protein [Candidatus Gracilibacteria bacterium]